VRGNNGLNCLMHWSGARGGRSSEATLPVIAFPSSTSSKGVAMADLNATGSASGLSDNTAGALAYLTFIPAIFFLVAEPYNRNSYIRFHAWQSILLFVAAIAVDLVLGFVLVIALMFSPFLHLASWRVIELFWFAVWLVCMVNAAQGKRFKLPVIGILAEQQASK
jgi:uncharacterized membrane protein